MKKILVIEDNLEVRENLEETLELFGYNVDTAEDGNIGVTKALQSPPDLIICDVMMPKLDGYGVLNILSKKPATADIPFIFLTAKSEKEDFRRGMNLGADDYLSKPFFKDELLQVIEARLKKSARLKAKFDRTASGWKAFVDEAKGYEELKKLAADHATQVIPKKGLLFEEGNQSRNLYFVVKGKIKVYKISDFGKEFIIKILQAGDFIGYSSLIKQEPYNFYAAALEETEVNVIPKIDFEKLLYANKDVASRLIQMLANNVREKEEQLLELAYNSVRKRVADAIVNLHDNLPENTEQKINILREDLASIVGTAKESVIRMLSEFKDDGYISINNGIIKVLNKEKLKKMPG